MLGAFFTGVVTFAKVVVGPIVDTVARWLDYRKTRAILEGRLLGQIVQGEAQARIHRKEMLAKDTEWPPFKWLRFLVFASILGYYVAVIADTVFQFPGSVGTLPRSVKSLIDNWGGEIVMYFCVAGGHSVFGLVERWLNRK